MRVKNQTLIALGLVVFAVGAAGWWLQSRSTIGQGQQAGVPAQQEANVSEPPSPAQPALPPMPPPDVWAASAEAQASRITAMGQAGRISAALELARYMLALPRHPDLNDPYAEGHVTLALGRAIEVLREYELWDQAIRFCKLPLATDVGNTLVESQRQRLLAEAFFHKRQLTYRSQLLTRELKQALADLNFRESNDEHHNEICVPSEVIHIDHAANDAARAHVAQTIRLIAALQQAQSGQLADAVNSLADAGASPLLLARLHQQLGEHDTAVRLAKAHAAGSHFHTPATVALVEVLAKAGQTEEAADLASRLMQEEPGLVRVPALHRRLLASVPDVDAPAVVEPADEDTVVAVPNELRRQFPLTWDAPSFTLPDEDGQMHSLHEYHGRPVLVVFYLGDGCLHCSRQLKGFAPVAADFEDRRCCIAGTFVRDVQGANPVPDCLRCVPAGLCPLRPASAGATGGAAARDFPGGRRRENPLA